PTGLALLIGSRLASALDYAHRKRDFEGHELGLVHRDVSPQNVLLTAEGDVKLCDFGIAKAVSKVGQTQMGALKGKLQYMSPEQAWGRPVDARSDLFSLGAVLFEMVTGERLFTGESEISVLEAVRQGRTRAPRQVDPSLPREVDEIVARALAVDPKDRFQTAGEMKQRLEAALTALSPATGQTDLALFIQRALEPAPVAAEPFAASPAVASWSSVTPAEPVAAAAAEAFPYPPGPETPVAPVAPVGEVALAEVEGGRKSRTLLYAAIAALIVIAILTFFFLNRRKEAAPPAAEATAPGAPAPVPAAGPPTAQVPATLPATQAAPAPQGKPIDIKAIVDQQVAAQEAQIKKQQDEKVKQLEKQLAASKTSGQPASAPAPAPAAATSEQAPPRPAPAEAAPQPPPPAPGAQKEPEPAAKAPEKTPEPAKTEPEAPRTKAGDLVEAGPGVSPPQLVSVPKAGYPPMARTLRVEGTVVVSVLVDENGQVQDVRMAEPIRQNVGLNEAGLAAARSAHYKPATKDGVRVKMWTRLRIPFKL
ncbi:MAG TPA: TonB family protein, partial [Thermoanaerobaculia bacterium]